MACIHASGLKTALRVFLPNIDAPSGLREHSLDLLVGSIEGMVRKVVREEIAAALKAREAFDPERDAIVYRPLEEKLRKTEVDGTSQRGSQDAR